MRELSLDCLKHVSGGCYDVHNCQGGNDFDNYMTMDSQQPGTGSGEDGVGGPSGSGSGSQDRNWDGSIPIPAPDGRLNSWQFGAEVTAGQNGNVNGVAVTATWDHNNDGQTDLRISADTNQNVAAEYTFGNGITVGASVGGGGDSGRAIVRIPF